MIKIAEIKTNGKSAEKNVEIKSVLTAEQFANAVRTIADSCFVNGEYRPEFKDMVKRYVVLSTFTNIDFEDLGIEDVFQISQDNWYYRVENKIAENPVYSEILKSVDELVEYRIRTRRTSFDNLCESLLKYSEKITNIEPLEEIAEKIKNIDDKTLIETIVNK